MFVCFTCSSSEGQTFPDFFFCGYFCFGLLIEPPHSKPMPGSKVNTQKRNEMLQSALIYHNCLGEYVYMYKPKEHTLETIELVTHIIEQFYAHVFMIICTIHVVQEITTRKLFKLHLHAFPFCNKCYHQVCASDMRHLVKGEIYIQMKHDFRYLWVMLPIG